MDDDGAGAAALVLLDAGWRMPPGVELLDLGTPGPYLAEYLRGYSAVILLDTVRLDAPPGTVRVFRGDELRRHRSPRLSPHSPDLAEALGVLAVGGDGPRSLVVVGVVPEHVASGTRLSAAVRAALPEMAAAAVAELETLGRTASRRATPAPPAYWWAAPA